MSNPGWHFKRRERSDEVADPIHGEFFDEVSDPDERRRGPAASPAPRPPRPAAGTAGDPLPILQTQGRWATCRYRRRAIQSPPAPLDR